MPRLSEADELARKQIREKAEKDLLSFAKLVLPNRVYGEVHEDLFKWWTRSGAKDHQLVLLPRDHQKSHCIAVRAAWWITKHPDTTIIYMSATANLAEKQLKAIKDILTSSIYTYFWPEMINEREGQRERWTATEISVDHPKRKEEGIRDPTVTAVGVTGNVTGLHCHVAILDDLVVPSNAYTLEGRDKVAAAYSQLASIEMHNESFEWVIGTRYHPLDLYSVLKDLKEERYDEDGRYTGEELVYEIMEHPVETHGDFLWPKEQREDGKWFGFDNAELARKKAKYVDKEQFYSQYYNNPNALENQRIHRNKFQYYESRHIRFDNGRWHFKEDPLNVYAAIDFAFSLKMKADFTAIVVIGIDSKSNIYILEIDRFKSNKVSGYFDAIVKLHSRWEFKKLRAEVTVAQELIVRDLQDYIKELGLRLSIDEYRPTKSVGTKEERITAALDFRYDNMQIYHLRGGMNNLLEHELLMARPEHDDIKDALAMAVEIAVPPMNRNRRNNNNAQSNVIYNSRFGGVAYGGRL